MGIWDKLFGEKHEVREPQSRVYAIPTVKFDQSHVTASVKADLKQNIAELPDVPQRHHKAIYRAALASILKGRDLHFLTEAIRAEEIVGMRHHRIAEISRLLHHKASALMHKERQLKLGVVRAVWVWSQVPCDGISPNQAQEHRTANGTEFEMAKGLYVNGKWTWPGREEGCKCISRSIIKGFSN